MTQTFPRIIPGISHESSSGPRPDYDSMYGDREDYAPLMPSNGEDGPARDIAWHGVIINHGADEAIKTLIENASREAAAKQAAANATQELLAKARQAHAAELASSRLKPSGWLRRHVSFR